MGLLSKLTLRRTDPPPSTGLGMSTLSGAEPMDAVRQARVQARRRLLGAAVLLLTAVVVLPLMFEREPRPLPEDIAITIPASGPAPVAASPTAVTEGVEPVVPARPVPAASVATPAAVATATLPAPSASAVVDPQRPEPKPQPKPDTKPAPKPEPKPPVKPEPKPEPKPELKPQPKPEPKPSPKPEPKPQAKPNELAAAEGKFVVQVGAFAEAGSAREARAKVNALGLAAYTQEVETSNGRRVRVRVGPYASRADADRAAARIHAAGLPASVFAAP